MSDLHFFSGWNNLWRPGIVHIFLFFLYVMNLVSFPLPFTGEIRPYFILMVIYYWAIFRPGFLLSAFVFVLGLLYDLILGFPIGLHAFLFLGVQFLIIRQRLFLMGQTFIMIWIGFFFLCLAFVSVEWIFFSFYSSHLLPLSSLLGIVIFSGVLFPVVSFFLSLLSKLLLPLSGAHLMKSK
ncbi:MAG: rod shape-determining protein MreD [Alphaproteobacteria bacterium]|nr:rod shape-determining protein MreD [Alphaproteobacteria bacterium]